MIGDVKEAPEAARSALKLQRHHLPHIFKAGNIHSHKVCKGCA